jgi:flagellar biosynthesis chaperone FliJ
MNWIALVTSFFDLSTELLKKYPDSHQKLARELYDLMGKVQRYNNMSKDDIDYSADAHLNSIDQLAAFVQTLAKTIKTYNEIKENNSNS